MQNELYRWGSDSGLAEFKQDFKKFNVEEGYYFQLLQNWHTNWSDQLVRLSDCRFPASF
jgi:hypothetical protein